MEKEFKATQNAQSTQNGGGASQNGGGKSREKFIDELTNLAYRLIRNGCTVDGVQSIIEDILNIMVDEFKPIINPVERGKMISEAISRALNQYAAEMGD
jgi:hypothetical protein